jgi:hypothetical protein
VVLLVEVLDVVVTGKGVEREGVGLEPLELVELVELVV